MTPDETARSSGRQMAHSLGVRVYLYRKSDGGLTYHPIQEHPDAAALGLLLVETFEAPPKSTPTSFADRPGIALP